jgi:hypothetical protein
MTATSLRKSEDRDAEADGGSLREEGVAYRHLRATYIPESTGESCPADYHVV